MQSLVLYTTLKNNWIRDNCLVSCSTTFRLMMAAIRCGMESTRRGKHLEGISIHNHWTIFQFTKISRRGSNAGISLSMLYQVWVRWLHWPWKQIDVCWLLIQQLRYNSRAMVRSCCRKVSSVRCCERKKWVNVVVKHIPVTLTRNGLCHTYHMFYFSPWKQFSRWEYHMHDLEELSAGNTNPSIHGVCAVLVSWW